MLQKPRNTWIGESYVLVMEIIMKFPTNYKQIMAPYGETDICMQKIEKGGQKVDNKVIPRTTEQSCG